MSEADSKAQQGVQSVEVGMRIVAALAATPTAMTLKQLASAAQMVPAKAHRYLVSLIRTGLVEQHAVSGRYDLGPLALSLGLAALGRLDFIEIGNYHLNHLREKVDETILLAVWGNRGPTVVRWLESSQPVTVNVRLGSVMPLLNSATGRAFLAWLPPAMTRIVVEKELSEPTCAIRDMHEAEALITEVRARGLSRVQGEMLPGVAALGAPVFNHQGEVAAVLTVLGPQAAFDATWDGRISRSLRAEARDFSRRLGYKGSLPLEP
jgi:DNA-binding IclR family transcriptional regulator